MTGWNIHFTTQTGEAHCERVESTERDGTLVTARQHVVFPGEYTRCDGDHSEYRPAAWRRSDSPLNTPGDMTLVCSRF